MDKDKKATYIKGDAIQTMEDCIINFPNKTRISIRNRDLSFADDQTIFAEKGVKIIFIQGIENQE